MVEEPIYPEIQTSIPTTDEQSDIEYSSNQFWDNKVGIDEDDLDAILADFE